MFVFLLPTEVDREVTLTEQEREIERERRGADEEKERTKELTGSTLE